MKKHLLLLFVAIMAMMGSRCFAVNYGINVGGVAVTSNNASNITGSGITGSVSYNPNTNTLTLNGATIINTQSSGDLEPCIVSRVPNLIVNLVGNNVLTAYYRPAVDCMNADLILQGTGSLTARATSSGSDGFSMNSSSLTIQGGCSVHIVAAETGILGTSNKTVSVINSNLTVKGNNTSYGPIAEFANVTISGTSITSPAGASYNSSIRRFELDNALLGNKELVIETINHSLWVAGHKLQGSGNYTFTGDGISGSATYNFSTNTLTLNGATISASSNELDGIKTEIPGMRIVLSGQNTITSTSGDGISSNRCDLTIMGTGSLTISSYNTGIFMNRANLTVNGTNGCVLTSNGQFYGISCIPSSSGNNLILTYAYLSAKGTRFSSINGFSYVSISGTNITYPANIAYTSGDYHYLNGTGDVVKDDIMVEAYNHSLWVAGCKMGGTNEFTFTGAGISGMVYYSRANNNLILNGATIHVTDDNPAIKNGIPNLKIVLLGNNTVIASHNDGILTNYANMTIQGTGTLVVVSEDKSTTAITAGLRAEHANLNIIGGCRVLASGNSRSIIGSEGSTLTINASPVYCGTYSTLGRPITGFDNVIISGIGPMKPIGIAYNTNYRRFQSGGVGSDVLQEISIGDFNMDLWVVGNKLTSGYHTFTGEGISGSVTYDYFTNTLTLNGATIDKSHPSFSALVLNKIPDLKINLVGSNTIAGITKTALTSENADFTIQGTGSLNASSQQATGIFAYNSNLTIKGGCSVTAFGSARGILGTSGKNLRIQYSNVNVTSNNYSVSGFDNVGLTGTTLTTPTGIAYNTTDRCYKTENGTGTAVTSEIVYETTNHSLWIADHKLEGSGTYSFTGTGISGTVTYNYSTNTLTLSNATIHTSGAKSGIKNEIPNLKVNLVGTNTITSASGYAFLTRYADVTIKGTGTLNLTSTNFDALYANNSNVTIQGGCSVNADGYNNDIKGTQGKILTITSSNVTAQGGTRVDYYTIGGFDNVVLSGTTLTLPAGVAYNTTSRCFKTNNGSGSNVVDKIIIETVNHSLWVAGHKLEGSGNYTFTGSGINGSVSYNRSTNTLTLNGATISATNPSSGIVSYIPNMKIQLVGANTITSQSTYSLYSNYTDLTIQGTGSLTLTSGGDNAIYVNNGNLTIQGGCSVNATGSKSGILGSSNKNMTIKQSNVTAKGNNATYGSIGGFLNVTLNQTFLATPSDIHYYNQHYIHYNTNNVATETIVIETINRSLWVAGHKLEGYGTYTFTGTGIEGNVSYNYSNNTLTLNNATINYASNHAIRNEIPNLTINLIGTNTVTSSSYSALSTSNARAVISGTGTLLATSNNSHAIYANVSDLTISGMSMVVANGGQGGIYGSSNKTLTVNGAQVLADGGNSFEYGSVGGFSTISLVNASVAAPANIAYNNSHRRYEYNNGNGNAVTEQITLGKLNYDIWVKGTQVTALNANDVLGDGTVSYDPSLKTLTLNGTDIYASSGDAIRNELLDLTINIIGTNKVESKYHNALSSTKNMTITGTGLATFQGHENGIRTNGNLVIMDGCRVYAVGRGIGDYAGVYGDSGKTLTINHSLLDAKETYSSKGVIYGFQNVNIIDSRIDEPKYPITWNASNHRYENTDGERVKGHIVIDYHTYELYVVGTQVTSSNANDVLGDGKVSYDPGTKTLTLNGVNRSAGSNNAINNSIQGLKINLVGVNTFTSSASGVISNGKDFTIEGKGRLYVSGRTGIEAANCNLTIQGGCFINAYGTGNGAYGSIRGNAANTLTINASWVSTTTNSTSVTTITGFGNLILTDASITTPENGYYSVPKIYDANGNPFYSQVIVSPNPYNLWVAGTQVTAANANDVLEDGKVRYNAEEKILTLNNASISTQGYKGIYSEIPNLKIELLGTNSVTSTGYAVQSFEQDFTIQGPGSLTATGSAGIFATRCNLAIRGGCTVNAVGNNGYWDIRAIEGAHSTLTVDCSKLMTTGHTSSTMSAIMGFETLQLVDVSFTTPSNGSYQNGVVKSGSTSYYGDIVISPTPYQLWIAGTQVTSANAPDFFNDGTISYNNSNKTLTLNNATINATGQIGINSSISNLVIELVGDNTVTSTLSGIYSSKALIIEGRGNLSVTGSQGICMSYSDLTIQGGCTVDITGTSTGNYAGIYGYANKTLTIDRSKVTVTSASTQNTAIHLYTNLNLVEVNMTTPANGSYADGVVYNNGNPYYGQVVIEPVKYDLWISGVQVTSANCDNFTAGVLSGTVSYDWEESMLVLDNATITYNEQGTPVIYSDNLSNLSFVLTGENYIVGNDGEGCNAIVLQSPYDENDLTFYGVEGGTLTMNADVKMEGFWNIYLSQTTVSLGAEARLYTTEHDQNDGFDIALSSSLLRAYSIYGMGRYGGNITGGSIMQPEGAYVDDQEGAVVLQGELATDVVIGCGFDLWIGSTQVTTLNADHITGDDITGNVSFDPVTYTLTLNNATIVSDSDGIHFTQSGKILKINLEGNNVIESEGDAGVFATNMIYIQGDGYLFTMGTNGIYCESNLTFRGNCTVEAVSSAEDAAAITGFNNTTLSIEQGVTLTAMNSYNGSESTIDGFRYFTLSGVDILYPVGGRYNTTTRRFEDEDGNLYNDLVEIGLREYDLWVGEMRVTSDNRSDILGDGTMSYDPSTLTLTLNGAVIDFGDDSGLTIGVENLRMVLQGNNTIIATYDGIDLLRDASIRGTGTLTIEAPYGIYGDYVEDANYYPSLALEAGCTVNVIGEYPLTIADTFTVYNSTFDASNDGDEVYLICENLDLRDVSISTPFGAIFDDNTILTQNHGYPDHVVIGPQYNLWVLDDQVTTANCNDVFNDGTVSYNPETNTLTLSDAHLGTNISGIAGVKSYLPDLQIELIGSNTMSGPVGLELYADATIRGTGNLYLEGAHGVLGHSANLTLEGGCQVMIEASYVGVDLHYSTLSVSASTLQVVGERTSSLSCGDLQLDRTAITSPEGVHLNTDSYLLVYDADGSVVMDMVTIEPERYALSVACVPVTSANASDILGNGKVSYDPVHNVLSLNDVTINAACESGIESHIEDLTITLLGSSSIISQEDGIGFYQNTTINGTGNLTIVADYCFYGYDEDLSYWPDLTIEGGCQVTAYCNSSRALAVYLGESEAGGTFTVDRSHFESINDNESSASVICGRLNLQGTCISFPQYGRFDESTYRIVDVDDEEPDYIVISVIEYPLYIAGVQVTAANAYNVLGDYKVMYFDSFNTLVLNNVDISSAYAGVSNGIPDLTIKLQGDNEITSSAAGINSSKDITIEGDGTLAMLGTWGIYVSNSDLTIQNGCTITAYGFGTGSNQSAIFGNNAHTLTIDGCSVTASTATMNYSAITGFESLNLIDAEMAEPEEGVYQDADVYVNDELYLGDVVIEPAKFDLWVAGVQVTAMNAHNVLGDFKVRYHSADNSLMLANADIEYGGDVIVSYIEDLTIRLEGDNYLTSTMNDGVAIVLFEDASITGPDRLFIEAANGIIGDDASVTLADECSVTIKCKEVWTVNVWNGDFTIDNAYFRAWSETNDDIYVSCDHLILNRTEITYPENGAYVAEYNRFYDTDDNSVDDVIIEPYNTFKGYEDNEWSNIVNWTRGVLPTANDRAYIGSDCEVDEAAVAMTIVNEDGYLLTILEDQLLAADTIINTNREHFVIMDGARLNHRNDGVAATLEKNIVGYGDNNTGGYYLICHPFSGSLRIDSEGTSSGTNLTSGAYDLYYYNEPTAYWMNVKDERNPFQSVVAMKGLLYANHDDVTIRMSSNAGLYKTTNAFAINLSHESEIIPGFNLVGNPFACNASVRLYGSSVYAADIYVLNPAGDELVSASAARVLHPMEAVFVQYQENYPRALFSPITTGDNRDIPMIEEDVLELSVSKADDKDAVLNNVRIHFGEGYNVDKLMLNGNNTCLSIVSEGKEYGSFYVEGQKQLVLNFKAAAEGTYTLSLGETDRGVTLIDTLTGTKTDFSKGAYTFKASPEDSVERFVLVF